MPQHRRRLARTSATALAGSLAVLVGLAAGPAGAATTTTTAVTRVYGQDRVTTAAAAAASFTGQQADAVVLTRSDTYADALAGAPLASEEGGPLLMTSRTALDPAVATALADVLPTGSTVYLLGDTNALSAAVEAQVQALGYTTRRLAGSDRAATAVAVAAEMPEATTVSVVTGTNYPDGLTAGALMGVQDAETGHTLGVVLLSDGTSLPAATRDYLASRSFDTHLAVGGSAVTATASSGSGWSQLAGADRYETAALVAGQFTSAAFFTDATTVVGVATGENWPDALAGSALVAYGGGPVLLTRPAAVPAATTDALKALQADAVASGSRLEHVLVLGSESAVSAAAYQQVSAAVA